MKGNLIVLKTQESQQDFYSTIEPTLTQKLAQNGVDITKTIVFKQFEELNKSLFGILESCSIILLDLSIQNIDFLFNQIDRFYTVKSTDFPQGKVWADEVGHRHCLIFDIGNSEFIKELDVNFLKQVFATSKFLTMIKTYGLDESEVRKVLRSIPNEANFEWYTTTNFLDCEINILAENNFYNTQPHHDFIRNIYEALGEYIYSDNDDSLYQKLSELISLRNVNISICDSLTGGLFYSMLLENLGSYKEHICNFYNISEDKDYVNNLKINPQFMSQHEINSVEMIYEMAATLLENTSANIALVLSGTPEKPYIALGDKEAIHLYKFHFNHKHSFVNNIMIQTSVFKLLKKLQKNDRLF